MIRTSLISYLITVKLKIQNPVISKEDLDKIKNYDHPDYKVVSIPILYQINRGVNGLEEALESILEQASQAVDDGANIIILSDRMVRQEKWLPVPALLATSLVNSGSKTKLRSKTKYHCRIC